MDDLLVFSESSGTTVTNHGSNADFSIDTSQGSAENTDWSWVTNADDELSYLSAYETNAHWQIISPTEATGPGTSVETINFAFKIRLDIFEGGTQTFFGANGNFFVYVTDPGGGGMTLVVEMTRGGQSVQIQFTGLTLGTDYQVAGVVDVSTISACKVRASIDGGAPSDGGITASWGATTFPNAWPGMMGVSAGFGDKRFYYWVFERGGTIWNDTEIQTFSSDPTGITSWPGGGGAGQPFPPSLYRRLTATVVRMR